MSPGQAPPRATQRYWNLILDEKGGPWLVSPVHGNPNGNVQHEVAVIDRQAEKVSWTGNLLAPRPLQPLRAPRRRAHRGGAARGGSPGGRALPRLRTARGRRGGAAAQQRLEGTRSCGGAARSPSTCRPAPSRPRAGAERREGATPSVYDRAVEWAIAQGVETATFHVLTPYPGTDLFRRMEAEGRLLHREWDLSGEGSAPFEDREVREGDADEPGLGPSLRTA